ncbi:hypothetical protein [Sediminivirga luteola]|uniref:hypothetical protein n=1 Tax=Sediminivirga luteola TaxID=1774748 RepID=UPI001F595336|nr:hypothetical protein [Sediminivirga luteola]MCI2267062.1 hypothetical protein [Sediminivirga luteola]
MSDLARVLAPVRRRAGGAAPAPARRRLSLIEPLPARRRLPFGAGLGGLLLLAVVGLLMLTIHISEKSFELRGLEQELDALNVERAYLEEDLAYRSSPQNVAKAAEELGMQVDQNPIYIDLETGRMSEPDPQNTVPATPGEPVPGPRADIREDKRPDLRTSQRQEIVESQPDRLPDDPPGEEIVPPQQREIDAPQQREPREETGGGEGDGGTP